MSASAFAQQRVLSPSSSSPSSASPPPSRFFPSMNACHCLNMQLAVLPLSSPRAQQSAAAVSDFFTRSPSSPFLSHSFLLGQLESKQIQLEALTLVTAIAIPSASSASSAYASSGVGWVLFRCLGCHTDCFAVEDSATSPRCAINLALAVDAEIALLQTSAQYSAVFNICIPTPASSSSLSVQSQGHTPRPHSSSSSSSSPSSAVSSPAVMESLRSALEHSIDAERVAMQMRVNQFVAEESSRFSQYERRGRKELTQLIAFISEEDRGGGGNSPQPAPVTPSRSPASPRVSLVPAVSAVSALTFLPLAAFLRRPSCQSPRLQRLLMDGLKHCTVSDEHAADALSASGDGEEEEDGSTASRPSSSSSAALTLNLGKLSPRQSIVVAVPQLSSLMRKGSRHQEEDSGDEEDLLRSQELIVRWREQEDEREREDKKRKEDRKQKRRRQRTGKGGRDRAAAGDAEDDEEEAESAIFQLDSPTAEDTWTDMQLDSEDAGRRRGGGDDVLIISTVAADEKEEKAAAVGKEVRARDDGKDDEAESEDEEDEDEEAANAAQEEEEEDGSLSDDEAVAKTSQADIIAIARSSVVSSIPIPSSASATRAARAAADRDVMVPSSLPIPIPTALRQLVHKSQSPSIAASAASTSAAASASSHRLPFLTSCTEGARRDSLHALAAQRRSTAPSHPPASSSSQRAVSLIPEHEPQAAAAAAAAGGDEDAGSSSPLPHSPPSASSPFIPPHTLTEEPFFSFAKYRHLPGVRGAAGGGLSSGGLSSGGLSSSLPSAHAGTARQPTGSIGAAGGGGTLFRKEETGERRRAAVSGLTAALSRRAGIGMSSRGITSTSSDSAAATDT